MELEPRLREFARLMLGSKREAGGCWTWQHTVTTKGYAQTKSAPRTHAHRFVYEMLVGPIPKGSYLHHGCRNKRCLNPAHLSVIQAGEHSKLHNGERRCRRCGGELTPSREGKRTSRRCAPCRREQRRGAHAR